MGYGMSRRDNVKQRKDGRSEKKPKKNKIQRTTRIELSNNKCSKYYNSGKHSMNGTLHG